MKLLKLYSTVYFLVALLTARPGYGIGPIGHSSASAMSGKTFQQVRSELWRSGPANQVDGSGEILKEVVSQALDNSGLDALKGVVLENDPKAFPPLPPPAGS